MHSQITSPNADSGVEDHENEHHHEKRSVMKKVKDKAKKMKDTLKFHGQGHHDDDHVYEDHLVRETPNDHDLDEEEEEEMANDPKIHGASGLDSTTTISSSVHEQVGNASDRENYYGSSAAMEDDDSSSRAGYSQPLGTTDLLKTSLPKHGEEDQARIERTSNSKDVPYTRSSTPPASVTPRVFEEPKTVNPIESFSKEQEAIRGKSVGIEEDPDAPKTRPQHQIPANYETKIADLTGEGTKEVEASSLVHKLGQMDISDESKAEAGDLNSRRDDQAVFSTASHDQFSPEQTPPMPIVSEQVPQSLQQKSNASESQEHPAEEGPVQSSYTQKISSATSAIADGAIYAKNVVASKLGYGGTQDDKEHVHDEQEKSKESTSAVVYGKKIASAVTAKITPVYQKVAGTGSNLMSTAHDTHGKNDAGSNVGGQDKGVSARDYFSEKLKPGEEDRALSEVISEALRKEKPDTEQTEKKLGKVTESEKVKEQLGTAVENSDESLDASAVNPPGSTVVSKLKGMVGSYFGGGGETRSSSQQSLGSNDSGGLPGSLNEEETRVKDSGN